MITPVTDVIGAVGNTPLVRLKHIVPKTSANVFVKLEYFNPTGSYKERMALAIIEEAERRGDIKPGTTIVEYTGGSTGTSLAWVCATKGYRFIAVSSDAFAKEKLQTIQLFGARLEITPSNNGIISPELFEKMKARTEDICSQPGHYHTRQFLNEDAIAGYRKMGEEILQQISPISAFCAAAGTAGMVAGVTQVIKSANPGARVVILEPASSPVLTQGIKGTHKVEGIGVGYFPPLLHKAVYDEFRAVEEAEARAMARTLAAKEGIFAGVSSGLNVVAALQLAKELGPGHNVITVACDSGMKYLANGLFD